MSGKELVALFFQRLPSFATVDDFENHLAEFLSSGIHVHWEAGEPVFGFTRAQLARLHGLKIEIRSREHAPPHFHVSGNGIDASFDVVNGVHLKGRIDRQNADLVRVWWEKSRSDLIRVWNETRPDRCQVGPIVDA